MSGAGATGTARPAGSASAGAAAAGSPRSGPRAYLTLIRHGETVANHSKLLQGQSDSPLSLHGAQQVEALGRYWGARQAKAQAQNGAGGKRKDTAGDDDLPPPISMLISSPIGRARKTADAIAQHVKRSLVAAQDINGHSGKAPPSNPPDLTVPQTVPGPSATAPAVVLTGVGPPTAPRAAFLHRTAEALARKQAAAHGGDTSGSGSSLVLGSGDDEQPPWYCLDGELAEIDFGARESTQGGRYVPYRSNALAPTSSSPSSSKKDKRSRLADAGADAGPSPSEASAAAAAPETLYNKRGSGPGESRAAFAQRVRLAGDEWMRVLSEAACAGQSATQPEALPTAEAGDAAPPRPAPHAVLVTHGMWIRTYLAAVLGPDQQPPFAANTGCFTLELTPEARPAGARARPAGFAPRMQIRLLDTHQTPHLAGIRRQRGGISSLPDDGSQPKLNAFFKPATPSPDAKKRKAES